VVGPSRDVDGLRIVHDLSYRLARPDRIAPLRRARKQLADTVISHLQAAQFGACVAHALHPGRQLLCFELVDIVVPGDTCKCFEQTVGAISKNLHVLRMYFPFRRIFPSTTTPVSPYNSLHEEFRMPFDILLQVWHIVVLAASPRFSQSFDVCELESRLLVEREIRTL